LCVFFFLIEARPEEIIVTIGAVEGLSAALLATVDPGDEVLLPTPTYSPHVNRVRLAGGRPVFVETKESAGFALDVEAMKHG
jgi:aspartate/methionine/tyrosine aminotransferase